VANQKVDKKIETLTCWLLPVAYCLKSSKIFATNKIGLLQLSGYLIFLQVVKYLIFQNFFSIEFCHNLNIIAI